MAKTVSKREGMYRNLMKTRWEDRMGRECRMCANIPFPLTACAKKNVRRIKYIAMRTIFIVDWLFFFTIMKATKKLAIVPTKTIGDNKNPFSCNIPGMNARLDFDNG